MRKKLKIMMLCLILFTGSTLWAQDTSKVETPSLNPFSFNGYVEIYYLYSINKPSDNKQSGFIYSHIRHNEFNLNLGFLKGSYNKKRIRANLAIAAGTYMTANYAAEAEGINNIYEANAGIKLSKKKNLWIDAGIFSSHIGFESAVSKDCWTLTRSMMADNSPYFESGAKLTYASDNNKWMLSGLILNGWQRIKKVDGNSLMSYGTQIQYKPSTSILLNYSTFIGTDKPDSIRLWRYFHNFYTIINFTTKFGITAGVDIGSEQKVKGSNVMNTWYSTVLILKYAPSSKWALAARGEYYNDKNGVIIVTETPNGFQTAGFSANIDYAPTTNALMRLELRSLNSKDDIFTRGSGITNRNTFITCSIAVGF
jgi:hypothetical protein